VIIIMKAENYTMVCMAFSSKIWLAMIWR